ncbi:MAG: hypothetical protein IGR76_10950 [Synechococcales cyanobacterium T60_A2020_003]|nr:hypothetical protein [Synechococcales cyanobacterium T60_A2020_003]
MQAQYQAPYTTPQFFSILTRIFKWISEFFYEVGTAMEDASNLHVERVTDEAGDRSSYAYDPRSSATFYAVSECELTAWVETHFSI